MSELQNPLLSDSASDWERLIESVDPASLLLVIDRRMTAALKNVVTAEDILQESLLHAWRDRKRFEWQGIKSFRAWLLTIADHRIQDAADAAAADKRGGGRIAVPLATYGVGGGTTTSDAPDLPAGSTTPSRIAAYREQAEVMRTALEDLPEEYRDIVRLRLFEHCALEEIAARLEIGASAVRHRFRKGSELYLGRLRAALGSQSRPPTPENTAPESAAEPTAGSSPSEGKPDEL